HAYRCEADAAVAQHLGPDATGGQHDHGTGFRVNAIADQDLGEPLAHRLEEHGIACDSGCTFAQVGRDGGTCGTDAFLVLDTQHHTAYFCLMGNGFGADLCHHGKLERKL